MQRKLLTIALALSLLTACTTGVSNERGQGAQSTTTDTYNYEETMDANKVDKYEEAPAVLPEAQLATAKAVITTTKGDIEISLFGADAPQTVSNFIFLANEKFYDNLTFHRREEGFVIQGGDPAGNGTGGPGYTVPAEINGHKHIRGAVAMARLGDAVNPTKASSGSQFYICLDDAEFLDGEYTVFGQVTKGLDIVDQIKVGDNILSISITN
jgi:peptidyl-prolyl cis-trans isomerase B (cyclophilin B)